MISLVAIGMNVCKRTPLSAELLAQALDVRFWKVSWDQPLEHDKSLYISIGNARGETQDFVLCKLEEIASSLNTKPIFLSARRTGDCIRVSLLQEGGWSYGFTITEKAFDMPLLYSYKPSPEITPGVFFLKGGTTTVVHDFSTLEKDEQGIKLIIK